MFFIILIQCVLKSSYGFPSGASVIIPKSEGVSRGTVQNSNYGYFPMGTIRFKEYMEFNDKQRLNRQPIYMYNQHVLKFDSKNVRRLRPIFQRFYHIYVGDSPFFRINHTIYTGGLQNNSSSSFSVGHQQNIITEKDETINETNPYSYTRFNNQSTNSNSEIKNHSSPESKGSTSINNKQIYQWLRSMEFGDHQEKDTVPVSLAKDLTVAKNGTKKAYTHHAKTDLLTNQYKDDSKKIQLKVQENPNKIQAGIDFMKISPYLSGREQQPEKHNDTLNITIIDSNSNNTGSIIDETGDGIFLNRKKQYKIESGLMGNQTVPNISKPIFQSPEENQSQIHQNITTEVKVNSTKPTELLYPNYFSMEKEPVRHAYASAAVTIEPSVSVRNEFNNSNEPIRFSIDTTSNQSNSVNDERQTTDLESKNVDQSSTTTKTNDEHESSDETMDAVVPAFGRRSKSELIRWKMMHDLKSQSIHNPKNFD